MRIPATIKTILIAAGSAALTGCLVSEEPVLDATNGAATPLDAGVYESCSLENGASEDMECAMLDVSVDEMGLYQLIDEEAEETMEWRFHRVGRRAYAVQVGEGEDEGYAYYYARLRGERMQLTFMQCQSLPGSLRARLIKRGDLAADDDEFETCTVNTLRGLRKAAKAYHRGKAKDEEAMVMELTPAPASVSAEE